MIVKSSHLPTSAESSAATSIIQGMGPQNRFSSRIQTLSSRSGTSLGPYRSSRACASLSVRPFSSEVASRPASSSGSRPFSSSTRKGAAFLVSGINDTSSP